MVVRASKKLLARRRDAAAGLQALTIRGGDTEVMVSEFGSIESRGQREKDVIRWIGFDYQSRPGD